jgi:hypothetical protein
MAAKVVPIEIRGAGASSSAKTILLGPRDPRVLYTRLFRDWKQWHLPAGVSEVVDGFEGSIRPRQIAFEEREAIFQNPSPKAPHFFIMASSPKKSRKSIPIS